MNIKAFNTTKGLSFASISHRKEPIAPTKKQRGTKPAAANKAPAITNPVPIHLTTLRRLLLCQQGQQSLFRLQLRKQDRCRPCIQPT